MPPPTLDDLHYPGGPARAEPERRARELSSLLRVSQALSATLDLDTVLQTTTDASTDLLGIETAAVYLLDDDDLYLGATTPALDPLLPESFRRTPLAEHPHIEECVTTRLPVVLADTRTARLTQSERAISDARDLRTLFYVPILLKERATGVLILGTVGTPREISASEVELARTAANLIAVSIENATLHGEQVAQTEHLRLEIERRRQAEARTNASEEKYRTLFERAHEAIFVVEKRTGRYLEANEAALRLTGRSLEELRRLTTEDVAPEGARTRLERAAALDEGRELGEVTYVRPDGTERVALLSVVPLDDEALFGLARDITQRKALEERLREAHKREAIGRLAGGIAHDFNNMLQVINGCADLALRKLEQTDRAFRNVQEIANAGARASRLTRQLLAFSGRQATRPTVFCPNTLILDMEKMLRRLVGEGVELVTRLDGDLGRVRIDTGHFEQVLVNLVVNARDAMPQGGTLTIATANRETHGQVTGGASGGGSLREVVVTVADTGHGMDEAVVSEIFEPFFTTKGASGTGLGLATVDEVVGAAGGQVGVTTQPGEGSAFAIALPRVDEPAEALEGEASDGMPRGTEAILVVEDDPAVRRLALGVLSQSGYEVLEAASGEEALRLARDRVGRIDLLLSDLALPGMNGLELADAVREVRPEAKLLYVSGYTDAADAGRRVTETGAHLLPKPYSPATLLTRIRRLLDGA